jgi:ferredoxin
VAAPSDGGYPQAVLDEFEALRRECGICYQCGACTSACPSGPELYRGPRRIVRLVLAGEIEAALKSDDLWRCTECGTCTDVCRMDIDVAGVLSRLRRLEGDHGGGVHCAERAAAQVATAQLMRRPRLDNLRFGAAMVLAGYLPKDRIAAARSGAKLARQLLPPAPRRRAAARAPVTAGPAPAAVRLPFYAGCTLLQDHELHVLVHETAAEFGVRLDETADAACCGHPSRGGVAASYRSDARVCTACPACDASLVASGVETVPLWDALTERASRDPRFSMRAAGSRFVPYVGCLADRDAALAALGDAARQSAATMVEDYPALHSGCCGALGGMYRGATKGSLRLLEFAARERAPVVTTCVLCRDNLRSAARASRLEVDVRFWPEFFRAVPSARPQSAPPAPQEHADV